MVSIILLCDRNWKIKKIIEHSLNIQFKIDSCLKDYIFDNDKLDDIEAFESQKQNILSIHLKCLKHSISLLIHTYPKYFLVFLVDLKNQQDFNQFLNTYIHYLSWADDNIQIPYKDEYYQIQQINSQLINTKRALMKSNQQLKQLLNEVKTAHDTISLLEHDELTGCYTSLAFYQKAKEVLKQNDIYDVIILKIVDLKMINEIFGKHIGDQLLVNISLFLNSLEHIDHILLAREASRFYLFTLHQYQFYEILYKKITKYLNNYPLPFQIHFKIGVYTSTDVKIPIEQMCSRARLSLDTIHAKDKRPLSFYNQSLHEQILIVNDVMNSLKNHEFQLYIQPKVNMVTQEIIGGEALVRWIHPQYGFITPDKFIPFLEKEGHIYDLDQYVWEESCKVLSERKKRGLRNIPISINIARSDLYEKDLVDILNNLIKKYDLSPQDLHLEILERACNDDKENIFSILQILKENNYYIEMDDFGAGDSSLAMIANMPIDLIKLDRQFLNTKSSYKQKEVIHCIFQLSKALNLEIIVEGVETQEQADFLMAMGYQFAQGYHYYKPQPAHSFLEID